MWSVTTPERPSAPPAGNYPSSWDDYIGQETAKAQLRSAAEAAKRRGDRLPHVLITGSAPGIGKTALGYLAAHSMGTNVKFASGKIKLLQARILLAGMDDRDVLVIEEMHTMFHGGKKDSEWILNFMEDGVIIGPRGVEPQPDVTIIGTTTDRGRFPEPVLSRFRSVELDAYTDEEAARVVLSLARRVFVHPMPLPNNADCRRIAAAASNNPRLMRKILEQLQDATILAGAENWTLAGGFDLAQTLAWMGLTEDGLTKEAVRYLTTILVDFNGEAVGREAMADRLQEPGGLHYTERLLMEKGLLMKSRAGRLLTQQGIRRARDLTRHL